MEKDEADYIAIVSELHSRIEALTVRLYREYEGAAPIPDAPAPAASDEQLERLEICQSMLGIDDRTPLPPLGAEPNRHDLPGGGKTNCTADSRREWRTWCIELSDLLRVETAELERILDGVEIPPEAELRIAELHTHLVAGLVQETMLGDPAAETEYVHRAPEEGNEKEKEDADTNAPETTD